MNERGAAGPREDDTEPHLKSSGLAVSDRTSYICAFSVSVAIIVS
jgi:hypothetical protein